MSKTSWSLLLTTFFTSSAMFLFYGIDGSNTALLLFRLTKWIGLLCIGISTGVATLIFQGATHNNIITPSIIGFDALFVLIQTSLIFAYGTQGFSYIGNVTHYWVSLSLMTGLALLLFAPLVKHGDQIKMLLTGVILSVLFKSLTDFIQRLLSPEDYLSLQSISFADFSAIEHSILAVASFTTAVLLMFVWKLRFVLDILSLGKDTAIGLGVSYSRYTYVLLIIVAALTATATALVGPVGFLGLLVCALTHHMTSTHKHSVRIPAVACVSATTLVSAQMLFERIFSMQSTVSILVNGIGGVIFLMMIYKNTKSAR